MANQNRGEPLPGEVPAPADIRGLDVGAATRRLSLRMQGAWRQTAPPARKSVDTLRGYIRKVEIFEDHAAEGLL